MRLGYCRGEVPLVQSPLHDRVKLFSAVSPQKFRKKQPRLFGFANLLKNAGKIKKVDR